MRSWKAWYSKTQAIAQSGSRVYNAAVNTADYGLVNFAMGRIKEMPNIAIDMFEGRSKEEKAALCKAITEAVQGTLRCPAQAVHIIIRENPKENFAHAGELLSENH